MLEKHVWKRVTECLWVCLLLPVTWQLGYAGGTNGLCRGEMVLDKSLLPLLEGDATFQLKLQSLAPFDTVKSAPVNLAIVIDRSSSMQGPKIHQARLAAQAVVDRLRPVDRLTIVSYSDLAVVDVPSGFVRDKKLIRHFISKIEADGSTALYSGVQTAASQLMEHRVPHGVNRIILLSDGQANVGPSSPFELAALGAQLSQQGITVSTIGLGAGYNEKLMTALSGAGEGNAWFAENAEDLGGIFDRELGDINNLVAHNIQVTIDFGSDVTPLEILTGNGRIHNRQVTLSVNQLYHGRDRSFLVKLRVPSGVSGDTTHIAHADIVYQDPIDGRSHHTSAKLSVRRESNPVLVEASLNKGVIEDVTIHRYARAQKEIMRLHDGGQREQAMSLLELENAHLEKMANDTSSAILAKLSESMQALTQRLKMEGMTAVNRKWISSNNYQMSNQTSFQYYADEVSKTPNQIQKQ